ncbi:MAG: hypothetical protein JWQ14_3420 [Adhaeribacter sp.]|nr:hypothetical protein [Adhaeribacter sp.]
MKSLFFIWVLINFPLCTFGQENLKDFLVSASYNNWDSIKCKEFYDIAEYNIGIIETPPHIKGIDRMLKKNIHPVDVPESLRLGGIVIFRFVLTKTNGIECLKIYSALPQNYINAAIVAFKELEFESAANNGQKLDYRMTIPIRFSNVKSNNKKTRKQKI